MTLLLLVVLDVKQNDIIFRPHITSLYFKYEPEATILFCNRKTGTTSGYGERFRRCARATAQWRRRRRPRRWTRRCRDDDRVRARARRRTRTRRAAPRSTRLGRGALARGTRWKRRAAPDRRRPAPRGCCRPFQGGQEYPFSRSALPVRKVLRAPLSVSRNWCMMLELAIR